MAASDRRIINRIPVDFRVDYIHSGDYMISCSKNMSMDGMFINTDSPPPVGTHVNLIFPVDDNLEAEVAALVVWHKEKNNFRKPGMGVQFLAPLPQVIKQSFLKDIDRLVILSDRGINA